MRVLILIFFLSFHSPLPRLRASPITDPESDIPATSPDNGNGGSGNGGASAIDRRQSESQRKSSSPGVDWNGLGRASFYFLSIEHAFRAATEPGTRDGMGGKFFPGYWDSLRSLHGWADGDPFYVNYVGHPIMGAAAGHLFALHDRKYSDVEFGQNRDYWKGRLRATLFAAVYSAQFEMGLLSEATIGKIQRQWPQQGFVDYVVTPVVGLGWMITEDALDKYLVNRLERRIENSWLRLLLRSSLNPTQTLANVLSGEVPWYRSNRAGVYVPQSYVIRKSRVDQDKPEPPSPPSGVPPFEFSLNFQSQRFLGTSTYCAGGDGSAAVRLAANWQMVVDFGGCKMLGLEENLSGDSFTYLAGPRWRPRPWSRLDPHLQLLVGGQKLTQERFYPEIWKQLEPIIKKSDNPALLRDQYTSRTETNAVAVEAGGGIDLHLNQALSFRLARLEFRHAWASPLNGVNHNSGLQLTTGLVLQIGTW